MWHFSFQEIISVRNSARKCTIMNHSSDIADGCEDGVLTMEFPIPFVAAAVLDPRLKAAACGCCMPAAMEPMLPMQCDMLEWDMNWDDIGAICNVTFDV